MPRMSSPFRSLLAAVPVATLLLTGCKKEFDSPPARVLEPGDILTIADLRSAFVNNGNVPIQWRDSTAKSLYCVVTADEQNGNLYRNVYVQDNTGGMVLRLKNSGGLYQGDSIRIHLPGTTLSAYQGLLQIDSVDVDDNIVKQATNVWIQPQTVTIGQLSEALSLTSPMQGRLIRLENVQFIGTDTSKTYANAVAQATENRTLENCSGNTVIARNSGYANFAGTPVPNGKGSFVGVVGVFGTTVQLFIRDINEVQLNGPRCGENDCLPTTALDEDFGDVQNAVAIDLECWLNVFTQGSGIRRWRGGVGGAGEYAEATVASAETGAVEYWLVSPPLTYTPGMTLDFSSAIGSAWLHDGLSVHVSTDINLTNATTVLNAPWQNVNATLAGNTSTVGQWVPSGTVALSAYLNAGDNFVVGFKYSGAPSTANTPYRIDNVVVH